MLIVSHTRMKRVWDLKEAIIQTISTTCLHNTNQVRKKINKPTNNYMLQLNNPVLLIVIIGAGLFAVTYGTIGIYKLIRWLINGRKRRQQIPMILDAELKAKFMGKYKKSA